MFGCMHREATDIKLRLKRIWLLKQTRSCVYYIFDKKNKTEQKQQQKEEDRHICFTSDPMLTKSNYCEALSKAFFSRKKYIRRKEHFQFPSD